jgi:hypothetical protein
MQIVINIDEEIYKRILPYKDLPIISNLCNDFPEITHAIANGVPLPKGHGRLIDADKALGNMMYEMLGTGYQARAMHVLNEYNAPTIIEADRSEEDG